MKLKGLIFVSDEELIDLTAKGILEAKDTLVERYKEYCLKKATKQHFILNRKYFDVADIFSCYFVSFFNALKKYDFSEGTFYSYWTRISDSELDKFVYRFYRDKTQNESYISLDDDRNETLNSEVYGEDDNRILYEIQKNEIIEMVSSGKVRLNKTEKTAILLTLQNEDFQFISNELNICESAVRKAIGSATKKITKHINKVNL